WAGQYSPSPGSNIGLLAARAETGVQWHGYRLGIYQRADALVEASRDTADLVQQYKRQSGYSLGRTYALNYRLKGFEASGARLSKSFQLDMASPWQIRVGLGLSYLKGQRVKLETINGQIVTINTKDFNATANRQTTSDESLDLSGFPKNSPLLAQLTAPSGAGYAADVGLVAVHPGSNAVFELAIADLFGQIDWSHLPNTSTNYNSATKYYDANGWVNFNPNLSKAITFQNLNQKLDPKLRLAVNYSLGNFELKAATDYTQGYWFPQTGVGYHITPQWAFFVDLDWRFNTLGLSVQHDWFYLSLKTDNLNLNAAKAYGLTAGVLAQF
ncbi:MAG: hypothetical protein A2496_09410, partial [Burkholderiales bacterium RIFOXYC12_FULL_60_6]